MNEEGEILDLRSPADWSGRAAFTAALRATAGDMDRIVGKYDLPRPAGGLPHGTGMVRCGLNGCNELHYRGFLLRLKDGRETIIGRDCGRRELGAVFEEIEATFRAQETRQTRRLLLEDLQASRESLIRDANALLPLVEEAHGRVSHLRTELARFSGLWSQLEVAARQGGQVLVAVERSAWTEQSAKEDVAVGATIRHVGLLLQDTSWHGRALRIQVVHWLQKELDAEISAAGEDLKQIGALIAKAAEVRSILQGADAFCRSAAQLMEPANLAGLAVIRDKQLRRAERSNALDRALRRILEPPRA